MAFPLENKIAKPFLAWHKNLRVICFNDFTRIKNIRLSFNVSEI